MPQNDVPRLNSTYYSWNEVSLVIQGYNGGAPFRTADFTAVSFKETLEPGEVRGRGNAIRGTTEGEYKCEASITMTLGAHARLLAALAQVAKAQKIVVGAVMFSLSIDWRKLAGEPIIGVSLVGCRIKELGADLTPGTDATEVEMPLMPCRMRLNGISLGEVPK